MVTFENSNVTNLFYILNFQKPSSSSHAPSCNANAIPLHALISSMFSFFPPSAHRRQQLAKLFPPSSFFLFPPFLQALAYNPHFFFFKLYSLGSKDYPDRRNFLKKKAMASFARRKAYLLSRYLSNSSLDVFRYTPTRSSPSHVLGVRWERHCRHRRWSQGLRGHHEGRSAGPQDHLY